MPSDLFPSTLQREEFLTRHQDCLVGTDEDNVGLLYVIFHYNAARESVTLAQVWVQCMTCDSGQSTLKYKKC